MIKKSYFEKLYQRCLDTHEELMKMFSPKEIEAINKEKAWVAYATDSFFSGWAMSKDKLNHITVICWSREQADAVYRGLCEKTEMKRPNTASIAYFLDKVRKTGTWSVKNANECPVWNKGIIAEATP